MNTSDSARKPWFKNWKIVVPTVAVLGVIGIAGGAMDDSDSSETVAEETTAATEKTPTWQRTQDYKDYCTGEPDIADELQPIVDAVTIPDGGHVWDANINSDSDNPEMSTVYFALCSNASGDELREIAETIAIEVKASEHGDTVSEMGVNASYANTSKTETILRDDSFQSRTHDGGESFENGSYRAAWQAAD